MQGFSKDFKRDPGRAQPDPGAPVLATVHPDLYDGGMADNHRPLRLPAWRWEQYAEIVGDIGRTPDLKIFMDWQIDNPDLILGPDMVKPHDFLATIRIETVRWQTFMDTVGDGNCAGRLRRYILWRILHPEQPLPGRRLGPLRRSQRRPALV